jgi:hypothetical protein
VLGDEARGQPLDRVVDLSTGRLPRRLFSGGRILALRGIEQRIGRELAGGGQCDAGRQRELAGAAGGVAVA